MSPRIIFFGTPAFAVPVLESLARHFQVTGVVTAPDKPVGRKKILTPSPVKIAAERLGIPVVSVTTLPEFDLAVVAAYNRILPGDVLAQAPHGFLNIHPSLLPAYRGPSPVRSAIMDGLAETGVSIMLLDNEMDHGPILAQKTWFIPPTADAATCELALMEEGADLLIGIIPGYLDGSITPRPQDHARATYTKKFTREDGRLDLSRPAVELLNQIRALADNPGTWTTLADGSTINILSAHVEDNRLVPDMVQPAGGKAMSWADFQRGHPDIDTL